MLWRNTRFTIRKNGEDSIWYKLLSAIFNFFSDQLSGVINYIYNQMFIEYADFTSLKRLGREYHLYPRPGELKDEFKARLQIKRSLIYTPPSTALNKKIFRIYLNVDAEIIQENLMADIFTVGVTPLGTAKCVSSNYMMFTWRAIIPDLSGEDIDRDYIIKQLNEYNPNNEFIIQENRPGGYFQW